MAHKRSLLPPESFGRAVSVTSILIGCLAIAGWVFDIEPLRNVYPGLPSTTGNGALMLILIGVSLWSTGGIPKRSDKRVAIVCAALIVIIAAATFMENVLQRDFGIDQLLVRQVDAVLTNAAPGRMAPHTALSFWMLGVALLLLNLSTGPLSPYIAHGLSLLASLIGQLVCVGYGAASPNVYMAGRYGAMSVEAAVMIAFLGFAVLCAHPNRGLMAVLSSSNAGGVVARRLLPLGFGFLPLLVLISWIARILGLGSFQFGGFIVLVLVILVFAVPILWTSMLLYRTDNKRMEAEKELADQYEVINNLNYDLRKQATELQALNKELESFSYSVSHDLRAPLRHIAGYIHLLERRLGSQLDDDSRRYLSVITDASLEMGTLIDDLLSFSKMGRTEMLHAPIELNGAVRKIVKELQPAPGNRAVEWTIHPLPRVQGDPSMIRLVMTNFITNALKFTQTRATAMIQIGSMDRGDGENVIYVRDNGVGFDMQYAHKLFGVFQRLHRTEEFEGTGIGLATVRRIIQRHGGKVWAEAAPNEGATFYFSLPRDLNDTVSEPQPTLTRKVI